MKRDWTLYIGDLIEALQRIETYTKGMDLEEFKKDTKTVDAVIRNLEIIGEAVKKIPERIRKSYPDIEWREMAGMRDKLIHAYFMMDITNAMNATNVTNARHLA